VQPLHALGTSAVDSLLEFMDGTRPAERVLTCTTAIRQSCGCPPRRSYHAELAEIPSTAAPHEKIAISEMVGHARHRDADAFILRLNRALAATTLEGGELGKWNDYLSAIHYQAAANVDGSGIALAPLFEFARVLIGESESRLQAVRRVTAENRLAILRATSASLAGAFEMPVMMGRLEAGLARLGIGEGYIALFEQHHPAGEWSRLVMSPARHDRSEPKSGIPRRGVRFHSARLLPPRIEDSWREGRWVLEPLVFQNEPLGYMLLPGGAEEPAVYDTLREQVASALKGALLLDQVLTHERRLQIEVSRRTGELTRTNRELTQEIDRRMRLEKEVIEISNRTMQRIGQDLHDDLCQHLAGIALHASVLRGTLSADDAGARTAVEQIGTLLADSIARAKQIARGLYPAGLEERGLVAAVEELVLAARRTYPAAIDFRASPDFRLPDTDRALQVYRIVQEALSNALKHSGSERVEVRLYREEPSGCQRGSAGHGGQARTPALIAEVSDYGTGLPAATTGDGMGLRIMRYRAETAAVELRVEKLDPGTRVSCRINGARGEP
jgi:signal transduction histidine kinase